MGESSQHIPRDLLAKYFRRDPRLLRAFEEQAAAVIESVEAIQANVAATSALQDATVITLSPNEALTNEYVIAQGDGIKFALTGQQLTVAVNSANVARCENPVRLKAPAGVTLFLPVEGELLSDIYPARIFNKTLDAPALTSLVNALDDTAAATAGVPVGGVYHNAGALRVRLA